MQLKLLDLLRVLFLLFSFLMLSTPVGGFLQQVFPLKTSLGTGAGLDLCPGHPEPYADPNQLKDILEGYFKQLSNEITELVEKDVGGTVVNIVYKDAVIWSGGFGVRNMSDSGPGNTVNGDTIFRIGSISKVFTAMLMLQFRDMGLLHSLDSDVTELLPELKIKNPFQQKRSITFNQLASHMAGLPREVPCPHIFLNGCSLSDHEIYSNLSKMELINPPGTWPQYSNLGLGILGRALEKINGQKWEDMLQEMILKPLGMNNTGTSFTQSIMNRLAVGYAVDGTIAKLIDIGYEAPAGQMYSSANDLSKLMMFIVNGMNGMDHNAEQHLDSETLREWMQPAYMFKDGTGFGRPWEFMPTANYTLRTKNGGINGYQAEFLMAPEIKTGVVIMKSCLSCPSFINLVTLGATIINKIGYHLSATALLPPVPLPPSPHDYVGEYITKFDIPPNPEEKITIVYGDLDGQQALMGQQNGFTIRLEWKQKLGRDVFQISSRGLSLPCAFLPGGTLGEYVEFQRSNYDDVVTGLIIPGFLPGNVFKKTFQN